VLGQSGYVLHPDYSNFQFATPDTKSIANENWVQITKALKEDKQRLQEGLPPIKATICGTGDAGKASVPPSLVSVSIGAIADSTDEVSAVRVWSSAKSKR